jgi:hypothetical protein
MLPDATSYRWVSRSLLFAALKHLLGSFLVGFTICKGHLTEFSVLRLLQFEPHNPQLCQATLIAMVVSTLSLVPCVVALREVIDRRYFIPLTIALVFVAIGVAHDLQGLFTMIVIFPAIAGQFLTNGYAFFHQTIQLAWSTFNQSFMECVLVANTLYGMALLLVAASAHKDRSCSRIALAFAAPIVVGTIGVSVLAFCGEFDRAALLMFVTKAYLTVWAAIVGWAIGDQARVAQAD